MDGQPIDELEAQLATLADPHWGDSQFFFHFPDRTCQGGFTGFEPSARAIDLARPESALFVDQQNLVVADDEKQSCPLLGNPVLPFDVGEGPGRGGQGGARVTGAAGSRRPGDPPGSPR